MSQRFIVVGGGMIGLASALGLRQQGHRVTLIEQGKAPTYSDELELRVSAIAHHSRALLTELGVWQQLPADRLGPYTAMEVWDQDSFGRIAFAANEVNQADLGAIVENRVLETHLWQAAVDAGVELMPETAVQDHGLSDTEVWVEAGGQRLRGDYLLAADGVKSPLRQAAGLPLTFWDYQQQGCVAVIRCSEPHNGCARQVFLPSGPVAWLPLADPHHVSLVWSADSELARQLQQLDDNDFIKQLQRVSDQCLGQLELVSQRGYFPLRMQYAKRWLQQRLLLIGDAAHSIHPLAGQGANLGFGDVHALLAVTASEFGSADLRQWERQRKVAAVQMIATMESFKRGFGTASPVAKLVRGLGLRLADRLAPLKRKLIKSALG
ncbi:FAD-dependent monooxygenase [Pseudidiomarina sp. 1APP75-32.1]|uniref:FAD-dependent monooxygenase n=1 Tax=Pseudidiomarina terrestris TaxID=2820060 RepID=A0AAW7R2A7_9GAMM|nr:MULTISPECIES: FAD-dependent oxidoreductase [unclassified Pseudidiomarina]MDN7125102.1 FAD-dependent monooxygenase [Pseudidiomarina sp. 1APP75-32.1]MDN7127495.1 FAD-dependent monooxygenase [Pseudidiomarina sp. 1APR75-33.1]MDN7138446.1 FAD-dependent monooxygenase [Pseudidiomarina sp. 1ASP75-14]